MTIHREKRKAKIRKTCLLGSLTVEAAAVVSIVLIAIAAMLLMEFRLHDRLAAENALYYALENYSYRNPDTDTIEEIRDSANAEHHFILSNHPTVEITPGVFGFWATGKIISDGEEETMVTIHIRTEDLLRASVLAELKNAAGSNAAKKGAPTGAGGK